MKEESANEGKERRAQKGGKTLRSNVGNFAMKRSEAGFWQKKKGVETGARIDEQP